MRRPFLGALAIVLLSTTLAAQDQPKAQLPPTSPDMRPAEVQRLFDAYLAMQAQETLALNEEQYARFLPRLRALQQARRKGQQERTQILNELQKLTNPRQPAAESAVLQERLEALQEAESRGAAELRKAYTDINAVLDVRQQARFRVLEEQTERRKLELLLRARQNVRATRRPPG